MRYFLVVCAVLIGIFFIFSGAGFRYQLILSLNRFMRGGDILDYKALRAENDALKTALIARQVAGGVIRQDDSALIFANVFASYPFTGRSSVRVDKGRVDGMRVGYPATFGGSILAGQIIEVNNRYSIVRMVGSPEWQIPVRIGPHKVAGLLMGGTVPRISMISADVSVAVGDTIITASDDLPYGLTVGVVGGISTDTTPGIFQEATVTFPYDVRDIAELAFMIWTSD